MLSVPINNTMITMNQQDPPKQVLPPEILAPGDGAGVARPSPTPSRDQLYAEPLAERGLFSFNEAVASVFPDMISRSVPGYTTVIAMTGVMAARHARANTAIYDLGCSLGASLLSVAKEPACQNCKLIGIDNSEAMLSAARSHLAQFPEGKLITLEVGDIADVALDDASVVIMNYTLQFVPIAQREAVLTRIRQALMPGDLLILSEKITLKDNELNRRLIDLHHDFKRQQGYSDLEIAQKRDALENVLLPETREAHFDRLKHAGFSQCDVWFQCLNFASFIAIA
jgi:tRNA (cmo5U34)-methyltransferase